MAKKKTIKQFDNLVEIPELPQAKEEAFLKRMPKEAKDWKESDLFDFLEIPAQYLNQITVLVEIIKRARKAKKL